MLRALSPLTVASFLFFLKFVKFCITIPLSHLWFCVSFTKRKIVYAGLLWPSSNVQTKVKSDILSFVFVLKVVHVYVWSGFSPVIVVVDIVFYCCFTLEITLMESDILSDDLVGTQAFNLAELIEFDKVYQKTFKFHQVCFYTCNAIQWFESARVTITEKAATIHSSYVLRRRFGG